jgi:hypothetical protein
MSSDVERGRKQVGDGGARELLRAAPEPLALPDLAALEAELEREIAAEQGVGADLRALSTPRRYLLVFAPLLLVAGLTGLLRPRLDLAVYPAARMALVLGVVGSLLVGGVVISLWSLAWRPVPAWLRTLVLALAPVSLLALYSLPAAHTAHPASLPAEDLAGLVVRALPCLSIGGAVAACTYLLMRAFDRGATRAVWSFAACAGLYANFLLQLHCAQTAPAHMLLGHWGVALFALLGVALFARSPR